MMRFFVYGCVEGLYTCPAVLETFWQMDDSCKECGCGHCGPSPIDIMLHGWSKLRLAMKMPRPKRRKISCLACLCVMQGSASARSAITQSEPHAYSSQKQFSRHQANDDADPITCVDAWFLFPSRPSISDQDPANQPIELFPQPQPSNGNMCC